MAIQLLFGIFSFSTWHMSFNYFLDSTLSNEKLIINCINSFPCHELFLTCCFKDFLFFSLVFSNLIMWQVWMVLCLLFIGFIGFLISVMLIFRFGKFLAIISSNIFFSAAFSLYFWDSYYMHVDISDVIPRVSKALLIFHQSFFSVFFMLYNFYWSFSSSLIISPATNLLLSHSSDFFPFSSCIFNFITSFWFFCFYNFYLVIEIYYLLIHIVIISFNSFKKIRFALKSLSTNVGFSSCYWLFFLSYTFQSFLKFCLKNKLFR